MRYLRTLFFNLNRVQSTYTLVVSRHRDAIAPHRFFSKWDTFPDKRRGYWGLENKFYPILRKLWLLLQCRYRYLHHTPPVLRHLVQWLLSLWVL